MSETWTLFGTLALFYFLEGIWWIPRVGVCVFSTLAGRCRIRRPLLLREDAASGLILPPTLICTGRRFITTAWPLSLSPEGISSRAFSFSDPFHGSDTEERFVPFAEVASLRRRGAHLLLGGLVFARTTSASNARRLHSLILDLSRLPEGERAARIREALEGSLDVRKARRKLRSLRWLLRPFAYLPALQLSALYIIAPVYGILFGIARTWPVLIMAQLGLALLGLLVFLRISRALPTVEPDERLFHAMMVLLFPPATPRYPEILSRDLVSEMHPIAVAAALNGEEVPLRACRRYLKSLESRLASPLDPEAGPRASVERWFAAELHSAIGRTLEGEGIALDSLMAAPHREKGAGRYCPACLTQYREGFTECADCPGIGLESFALPLAE